MRLQLLLVVIILPVVPVMRRRQKYRIDRTKSSQGFWYPLHGEFHSLFWYIAGAVVIQESCFFCCFLNLKGSFVEYLSRRGNNLTSRIPLSVEYLLE